MSLWGGRFSEKPDQLMARYNASLAFDRNLIKYDIKGSIVHARMLARTDIISKDEGKRIVKGLKEILSEWETDNIDWEKYKNIEDIHTLIETLLIKKIGDTGKKLHTARSRNDQVALDMRLYIREQIQNLAEKILYFMDILLELANKYQNYILPGYTHLQRAQPITFGHHLMAYYFKLKRDYERWQDNLKRVNILPLGCGALAGTSFPIDRQWVAEELGFNDICYNSLDGVSDRDFLLEFMSINSNLMVHLSRLSEEIILWSSQEFNYIELSDKYTTGSSIMPQKKNPDIAELTRGKTGMVFGNLMQLLTVMKGLPLAYNKDMQEDKEGVFSTVEVLKQILEIYPKMLKDMKVNKSKMEHAARKGYLNATELANYLFEKGIPFRRAHHICGQIVLYALEKNIELIEIPPDKWLEFIDVYDDQLLSRLEIKNCIRNIKSTGGPGICEQKKIIKQERKWFKQNR